MYASDESLILVFSIYRCLYLSIVQAQILHKGLKN